MRFLLISFLLSSCLKAQTTSDQVYMNAKVYTANDSEPFVTAIAVTGNSIVYVGDDEGVDDYIGMTTEVYNLEGKLVMPGFHDVHIHTLEASSNVWGNCFLDGLEPSAAVLGQNLADCNIEVNSNGWITAFGHSIFTLLDSSVPPIDILDQHFPTQPIVVMEETSHSVWVNSAALAEIGYSTATPDPLGGHIMTDFFTGELNGVLLDNAGDAILSLALATNSDIEGSNYEGLVNYGLPLLAQNGITSMCDGRTYWKRNFHTTWQQVYDNGELTARVVLGMWGYPDDEDAQQLSDLTNLYNVGDEMLRSNQVKVYMDGITINATAALHEPYVHEHDLPFDSGLNYFTPARLAEYITQLEILGYDFHIHAIGDRGITEALDAIEAARNTNGDVGARHRITHCEIVDSLDFPRFAVLNVIADCQVAGQWTNPSFWAENEYFVGTERADNLIPIKSLFDAGAHLTLSSDWDVSDLTPFVGIENALTRVPQNLATVEDAVKAYTIKGAYVMRQEDYLGSIEVGKLADFICVNQDIFTIPFTDISETEVELTVLDGEHIYIGSGFPVSISEIGLDDLNFKLSPNISSGLFKLRFSNQISDETYVTITDMRGSIIEILSPDSMAYSIAIDLSKQPEGVYLFSVTVDEKPLGSIKGVVSK